MPSYGLRLVSPPAVYGHPRVGSLRPTLEWEAFPRDEDTKNEDAGTLSRIRDVRYDVRVRRAEHPVDLVYARDGLPEPRHTLETSLAPDTRYRWRVRARFELDGRTRVTPWSEVQGWRRTPTVPTPSGFGFRTP